MIDWADSFVGHPAFDILRLTEDVDADAAARLADAWARRWRTDVPGSDPRRAVDLLRPVAPLRLAAVYAMFLAAHRAERASYHVHDVPAPGASGGYSLDPADRDPQLRVGGAPSSATRTPRDLRPRAGLVRVGREPRREHGPPQVLHRHRERAGTGEHRPVTGLDRQAVQVAGHLRAGHRRVPVVQLGALVAGTGQLGADVDDPARLLVGQRLDPAYAWPGRCP